MSLKTYLYRCRKENATVLFFILLNAICLMLNGHFLTQAVSSLAKLDLRSFFVWCLLNALVFLIWGCQIRFSQPAKERAIQAMNTEIRQDILNKIAQTSYPEFHTTSIEGYTSWLTHDIATINDLGFEVLELMLMQACNILFAMGMLTYHHPSFLLTILVFSVLMSLLPKRFDTALEKASEDFSKKNEAFIAKISDVLGGYDLLLSAGRLSQLVPAIATSAKAYADSKITYADTLGRLMGLQNTLSFISQISMITQAGLLHSLGLVPIGLVSSASYFASIVFAGLTGFFANYAELKNCQPLFDKFETIQPDQSGNGIELTRFSDHIRLQQLKLPFQNQILVEDFTVEKGGKYAIIGPSGAGKSSLLKLLTKHWNDYEGQLTIDQKDYACIRHQSLHQLISYVSQDSYLFQDSLRYNLTLGAPHTDDILYTLLAHVDLTDWVNSLEAGLDTLLVPNELSGGQKQRLCLARALLEDKPILLLDEATSALDKDLRLRIEKDLLNLSNKTLLMVSHHLTPDQLTAFDQVITLQEAGI